ncbi:hypothetical protein P7K49_017975 [Saguinus oedipus]|uniref:Uncharacterized protein n=1 Tax=Saguinus oedipus TaxID=9490 RepID=A0ABQ9V429_SAGOE|nr:hypothetical protein P7K49_017975 [Saguinus oedipus]
MNIALVEEVYFAQKERDEAVMSRLQLAIEDRDEAIARAKHMEMSLKVTGKFPGVRETRDTSTALSACVAVSASAAAQRHPA